MGRHADEQQPRLQGLKRREGLWSDPRTQVPGGTQKHKSGERLQKAEMGRERERNCSPPSRLLPVPLSGTN